MTARRDKWSGYTEVLTDEEGTHAWSQEPGYWKLVKDHTVYADVEIETSRERRRDLSGYKKFRVITRQKVKATVRAGWNKEHWYTTQVMEFSGGEVAVVKQLLEMFRRGYLFQHARLDVQSELYKLNATTLQMIEADDVYDYGYDKRSEFENKRLRLRKNIELLRRLQA